MFDAIGASDDKTAEYRELTNKEMLEPMGFNDHFRISFTLRMDRDEAILLSRKIEAFVSSELSRDVRVYVGVSNRR